MKISRINKIIAEATAAVYRANRLGFIDRILEVDGTTTFTLVEVLELAKMAKSRKDETINEQRKRRKS